MYAWACKGYLAKISTFATPGPSWILAFSSWCLSGPCCSPHRVVYGAETQGLMRCLYTSWHCCIPSLRLTAHVDKVVGMAEAMDTLGDQRALLSETLVLVLR